MHTIQPLRNFETKSQHTGGGNLLFKSTSCDHTTIDFRDAQDVIGGVISLHEFGEKIREVYAISWFRQFYISISIVAVL